MVIHLKQHRNHGTITRRTQQSDIPQAEKYCRGRAHDGRSTLGIRTELDTSFEDGMEKGMEKGIEKGMERGKVEEQRQIAANLKKQGINIETIAQCTGLSVEEINEL